MATTKAFPGVLHRYAPRLTAFEYTTTSPEAKPNSLLFIGGLTDGLETVPYVSKLAEALEPTEWSVFGLLLSSSYGGWGVGSLDNDIEEIAECVQYVKNYKGSHGKVVIMGHSTGSQDVLHYLYSPNPLPRREDGAESGVKHLVRPVLDGAIMQAPASDRESLQAKLKRDPDLQGVYEEAVNLARTQPFTTGTIGEPLPLSLTGQLDYPADTPVSGRRFLSLASPDSPENPAADDLFSSDLTDERLLETFGVVGSRGLLRAKLLALYSGNDEFAAPWIDKEALLQRWSVAADADGANKWDHQDSGVIPGASHNVKDVGQEDLIARVSSYLSRV